MPFQTYYKIYGQLLRRCVLHARQSSSSAASKRVAPVTQLRQSYIHHPGSARLCADTLPEVIDRAAVDYGDTDALIFVHQNIRRTWREVKQEADRLAQSFMSLGLESGDRIGIWATNLYEWQLTQYAAAKAGLVLVNVNQAYQKRELEYCLNKVEIRTLIAIDGYKTSDFYAMLSELLPELAQGQPNVPLALRSARLPHLRHIIMISQERKRGVLRFDDLLGAASESATSEVQKRQAQIDCDHPCGIQFTSGTTGRPKAATLSHHNVINNMRHLARRVGFDTGGHRVCMSVPLYHTFGCVGGSVMAPLNGNTLVFPSAAFDAVASIQAAQDERCTSMYGTPTMFVDMVNLPNLKQYDLRSLHSGLIAGAPVPFNLMEAMVSDLGLRDAVVAYGLTETSPLITAGFLADDMEHKCGTVGYPLDHTELKVVDKKGRIVPAGTPGELWTRGYQNCLGYWNDEDKTRAAITPEGWFLTGDVGVIMEDGYVKIVGRDKDMVIRGGENIYPAEIEDVLMSHPDILEAHVFGVPDDRMGEEVCVWIRSRGQSGITDEDVKSFCKGKIAHFKIPRYIQFRDDFPKTVTGKVQKYLMRKTMAEELGVTP